MGEGTETQAGKKDGLPLEHERDPCKAQARLVATLDLIQSPCLLSDRPRAAQRQAVSCPRPQSKFTLL